MAKELTVGTRVYLEWVEEGCGHTGVLSTCSPDTLSIDIDDEDIVEVLTLVKGAWRTVEGDEIAVEVA